MKRFPDIRFTSSITSPSVDIDSDDFTNCLASGSTILGYDEMKTLMKNIEQIAGDRKELRKVRCVVMDIDILMFGHKKCHTSDWDRKYVKTLMKQL